MGPTGAGERGRPAERRRAAVQLTALLAWLLLSSITALLVLYPALPGGWIGTSAQVIVYAVQVAPVLLLRPRIPLPLGLGPRTAVVGAGVLIAATVWAAAVEQETVSQGVRHAVQAVSAGVGEEVVFRGAIFALLRELLVSPAPRIAVNGVLFAAFHLPIVLLQHDPLRLVSAFVIGLALTVLRAATRGLALPAAVHVAIDLSS